MVKGAGNLTILFLGALLSSCTNDSVGNARASKAPIPAAPQVGVMEGSLLPASDGSSSAERAPASVPRTPAEPVPRVTRSLKKGSTYTFSPDPHGYYFCRKLEGGTGFRCEIDRVGMEARFAREITDLAKEARDARTAYIEKVGTEWECDSEVECSSRFLGWEVNSNF